MKSSNRRRLLVENLPYNKPALFLDRDGVLIEDRHYLCRPEEVQLCPGARNLLEHAFAKDWPVVVITNQSGISRGYFDWDAYEQVTDRLLELLGLAAPIAAIYANGHGPDAAPTSWRKPSPAMLQAAAVDLQLDLTRSLLIGDRLSDLYAGDRAGLAWMAHVQTGYGQRERPAVQRWFSQKQMRIKGNSCFELALLDSLLDFPFDRLVSLND
ncbi:HAD-IIIA family hydrolase [Synechococcus sp. MIT S9508]|uniref:D-glycero-alpha-D-manno-heptose-1,7-bisphosphate 7-phosphatase n=1 Tax=Synechococcus sp. MIT S9508 TaxID=1801629 RepID=UPI0007BC0F39|nr:HAD family hydrolase [Synechococcus sp. MIT S9508]KZR90597.1 D-glycero-beta-D-manno-heptose-1,7-bisphosphate 7-phosphatase [Synechococcus sp. MIT S9508]